MESTESQLAVTLRCAFCLTLNRVDLGKASAGPICGECSKRILLDRPVKVTEEDFDSTVMGATAPVLVDFYADWCAPCRLVAPLLDEIARDKMGRVLVAKLDTDRAPGIAGRFSIRGIPTLIAFQDGEEIDRIVGFDPVALRALADRVGG